jgi:hypothetical protein
VSIVTAQKIAPGHIHTRQVVMVHVAEETITIDLGGEDTCTVRHTRNGLVSTKLRRASSR